MRENPDTLRPRLVVGIGASAGGIDACKRFFSALPNNTGMTFILVMHLDPSKESHLADILGRATQMPVVQISESATDQVIAPDSIYVIAPDSMLELCDNKLKPSALLTPQSEFEAIDVFFASLAKDQKERSVGIIFSGSGKDGSKGIKEIHSHGGLCLVQSPESALFESMPKAALETGVIDHALSVETIPELLIRYAEDPNVKFTFEPIESPENELPPLFPTIMEILGTTYGVNFQSHYRPGTLMRRTERRMGLKQITDWQEYCELLKSDPKEVAALYNDLLIGITHFFRDPWVWETLKTEIIPTIVKAHEKGVPIKIWVPGCASGEEAYSVAILFQEHFEKITHPQDCKFLPPIFLRNHSLRLG